ncbi:MAG: GNAT family N-acetyltransferase [Melioribacteraceae bacterium]|nr:GNAT family N-acetyltransferase [Melioribacteraceae bacterium]
MEQELYSLLQKNPIQNIACLGFFSNYPLVDYFVENGSILMLGKSDNLWAHISSSSKNDLKKLLMEHHSKTKYYFSVEDWMIPLICEYGDSEWIMKTNRYVLEGSISVDDPEIEINQLDISSAAYIYSNSEYKKFTSLQYIRDRLSRDISAGVWVEGNLVAWGFTHDDGALGFLNVLNDFRKNGYGIKIIQQLINMRRDQGKSVFVNIVPDNIPAIKLISKLGFDFDRRVSWIKLK